MKQFFGIILFIGISWLSPAQYTLSGYIKTQPRSENIAISINGLKKGTQTDSSAQFILKGIPAGTLGFADYI